jgi:hypothetical protein
MSRCAIRIFVSSLRRVPDGKLSCWTLRSIHRSPGCSVLPHLTSHSRLHKMGLSMRFRRAFVGWENMGWIWSEKVTWRLL